MIGAAGKDPPLPYWWRDGAIEEASSENGLPSSCDVTIVGAGIAGLSAALHLARSGRSVVVLDKGRIAGGASSRNFASAGAGLALAMTGADDAALERAQRALNEDRDSLRRLVEVASTASDRCDFEQVPTLIAVRTRSQLDALAASLARAGYHPDRPTLLARADFKRYLETEEYAGGLLAQGHFQFDAGKLMAHLRDRVRAAGGRLFGKKEVMCLDEHAERVQIEGRGFALTSKHALVAVNGYSGNLGGRVGRHLARGLIPLQANMVATAAMDPVELARAFKTQAIVVDNRNNFYCIRMSQDRRRILFATRTGLRLSDRQRRAELRRELVRLFPQLPNVDIEFSWPGMIAISRDWRPHADFLGRVGFIAGCCGSGMTRHFGLGYRMAEAIIAGGGPDSVYSGPLHPFPPLTPKRMVAWCGARYYDFLDWKGGRGR